MPQSAFGFKTNQLLVLCPQQLCIYKAEGVKVHINTCVQNVEGIKDDFLGEVILLVVAWKTEELGRTEGSCVDSSRFISF